MITEDQIGSLAEDYVSELRTAAVELARDDHAANYVAAFWFRRRSLLACLAELVIAAVYQGMSRPDLMRTIQLQFRDRVLARLTAARGEQQALVSPAQVERWLERRGDFLRDVASGVFDRAWRDRPPERGRFVALGIYRTRRTNLDSIWMPVEGLQEAYDLVADFVRDKQVKDWEWTAPAGRVVAHGSPWCEVDFHGHIWLEWDKRKTRIDGKVLKRDRKVVCDNCFRTTKGMLTQVFLPDGKPADYCRTCRAHYGRNTE